MDDEKYDYATVRSEMSRVAGRLMGMGFKEESKAFAVLTHIIGYKVEGPRPDISKDEAQEYYIHLIKLLEDYLNSNKS